MLQCSSISPQEIFYSIFNFMMRNLIKSNTAVHSRIIFHIHMYFTFIYTTNNAFYHNCYRSKLNKIKKVSQGRYQICPIKMFMFHYLISHSTKIYVFKVKTLKYDATAREKKRAVGCRKPTNQWKGFYMTWTSVIKELMSCRIMQTSITNFLEQQFLYTRVIIARNLYSKRAFHLLNILYKTTPPCGDRGFILLTLVLINVLFHRISYYFEQIFTCWVIKHYWKKSNVNIKYAKNNDTTRKMQ